MKGYKRLFLIDGDSFIYKALNGFDRIDAEDKVLILLSDEALRSKLINRYRVKYGIPAEELDLKKSIQAAL